MSSCGGQIRYLPHNTLGETVSISFYKKYLCAFLIALSFSSYFSDISADNYFARLSKRAPQPSQEELDAHAQRQKLLTEKIQAFHPEAEAADLEPLFTNDHPHELYLELAEYFKTHADNPEILEKKREFDLVYAPLFDPKHSENRDQFHNLLRAFADTHTHEKTRGLSKIPVEIEEKLIELNEHWLQQKFPHETPWSTQKKLIVAGSAVTSAFLLSLIGKIYLNKKMDDHKLAERRAISKSLRDFREKNKAAADYLKTKHKDRTELFQELNIKKSTQEILTQQENAIKEKLKKLTEKLGKKDLAQKAFTYAFKQLGSDRDKKLVANDIMADSRFGFLHTPLELSPTERAFTKRQFDEEFNRQKSKFEALSDNDRSPLYRDMATALVKNIKLCAPITDFFYTTEQFNQIFPRFIEYLKANPAERTRDFADLHRRYKHTLHYLSVAEENLLKQEDFVVNETLLETLAQGLARRETCLLRMLLNRDLAKRTWITRKTLGILKNKFETADAEAPDDIVEKWIAEKQAAEAELEALHQSNNWKLIADQQDARHEAWLAYSEQLRDELEKEDPKKHETKIATINVQRIEEIRRYNPATLPEKVKAQLVAWNIDPESTDEDDIETINSFLLTPDQSPLPEKFLKLSRAEKKKAKNLKKAREDKRYSLEAMQEQLSDIRRALNPARITPEQIRENKLEARTRTHVNKVVARHVKLKTGLDWLAKEPVAPEAPHALGTDVAEPGAAEDKPGMLTPEEVKSRYGYDPSTFTPAIKAQLKRVGIDPLDPKLSSRDIEAVKRIVARLNR